MESVKPLTPRSRVPGLCPWWTPTPARSFIVQQGSTSSGSHVATLDLSGLGKFQPDAWASCWSAEPIPSSGASNWLSGTLYLAATNYIRVNGAAPAVDVGDAVNNGATSYVYLGQTNAIFADSMTIAHSKATCTLAFNPALAGSNPVLSLNGNTNSRMSTLAIGDFSAQSTSGSTTTGTVDLSGGTANAQVDTCYVGRGQTGSGAGPTTGTLRLGAGVFNVNTLNVGFVSINTAVGTVTGTVSVTNGTLVVNSNLVLAYNAGATATVTGTLNITNGTLLANNITAGGGASKLTLSGGWLAVSNTLGSLAAPLSSLTVSNGATLQFWVANNRTNAAISKLSSDNSGVINIGAVPIVLNYPSAISADLLARGRRERNPVRLGHLARWIPGLHFQRQFQHDLAGDHQRSRVAQDGSVGRRSEQ